MPILIMALIALLLFVVMGVLAVSAVIAERREYEHRSQHAGAKSH